MYTFGGLISYPETSTEIVDQSILPWFTCGCQDDWNWKRFKQIDKNDTENLVVKDTERNILLCQQVMSVERKLLLKEISFAVKP